MSIIKPLPVGVLLPRKFSLDKYFLKNWTIIVYPTAVRTKELKKNNQNNNFTSAGVKSSSIHNKTAILYV